MNSLNFLKRKKPETFADILGRHDLGADQLAFEQAIMNRIDDTSIPLSGLT
jgi:hypothetical protein